MLGDPCLVGGHPGEGAVPARLQLACDRAVLRIGRIVLPEGAIGGIAAASKSRTIASRASSRCEQVVPALFARVHGGRLHYAQQRGLDDIVDTQAAKADAAGSP